ncbi:hypothetical protein CQA53_11480 [Helicobacter didelphidarum]|uniref:Uncharacterized protein n=1 Tax=Helicobacter didelphidarum TaxID=2040648 RepID=A0A3D8I2Q1_9HELI|nr:hypothetical protein [Helicobacter didelphidarum]RDU59412.1 hypothetical protein CQA53_11480 [Helicobacter didelphidarum]
MWFLFFFIIIPLMLFVGLYLVSVIVIFLINKIFHKKYSQYLSFVLPCFSLIFYFTLIMGGISFKSIDPQYYEFKRLCETKAKRSIIDKELYEKSRLDEFYSTNPPNKKIQSRITKMYFENIHKLSNKIFYEYETYFYDNYGIFLKGDEGAGWHINFGYEVLDCKPKISYENKDYK